MGGIRDGKGKILRKTGPLFTELARNYPSNNYTNFCLEFNVGFAEANQILIIQNLGNQEYALKQVLNRWLDDGKDVTRKKLESALENAETGGLKSIVKKHFTKANLEEESSESSEEGEESAGRKQRKVRGKRSGRQRKSNYSSPGPSTSHKTKEVRPDDSDDTKVTDDIIESLAEDIGKLSTKTVKWEKEKTFEYFEDVNTCVICKRQFKGFRGVRIHQGKTECGKILRKTVKLEKERTSESFEGNIPTKTAKLEKEESSEYFEVNIPMETAKLEEESSESSEDESHSSLSSDPSSGQYHDEGTFDERGGKLRIPSQGVSLSIPPGALEKGVTKKISIEVLRDIPPEVRLRDDEMLVTNSFQCLPSGLHFAAGKPARLKIPHCANIIDPQKVQCVLYSWNHGKGNTERIEPAPSTCRVTAHHVELSLEHFTIIGLAFIIDWFYTKGKRMSLMPFLPRRMQPSRIVTLELRMVQKPEETSWKDVHTLTEDGHQPAKNDDDVMTIKDKALEVSCQLNDSNPMTEKVTSDLLQHDKYTVYFHLNFEGKANDLPVTIKVKQTSVMIIKFTTNFTAPTANLEEESPESSEEGEESASRKGRKVGGKRSGTKRKSNDSSPGPSTSHRKKKVQPDNTKVTDPTIESLAKDIGTNDNMDKLGIELGFELSSSMKRYKVMNHAHGSVAYAGTKQMLLDWRMKKGQGKAAILKEALIKSELTLYADKYFGDL